jgi:CRP-like cAMP-binding protein
MLALSPSAPQYAKANHLLAALPESELALLSRHLSPVRLSFNETLYGQGEVIRYVFFPIDCILANLAIMEDGTTVETSMIGKEAFADIAAIIGSGCARQWARPLIGGLALKMESRVLKELFHRYETIQNAVLKSYRKVIQQISLRAVCNVRHTVLQRLSCWLLMVDDRFRSVDLILTQDTIASHLGARRVGITQATGRLQDMGAIHHRRGRVHIADRAVLERVACECYAKLKEAFNDSEQ